jgi:hypothetical protein
MLLYLMTKTGYNYHTIHQYHCVVYHIYFWYYYYILVVVVVSIRVDLLPVFHIHLLFLDRLSYYYFLYLLNAILGFELHSSPVVLCIEPHHDLVLMVVCEW